VSYPRPSSAPPPRHSDAAHDAITGELLRVSLGGRPEREELLMPGARFTAAAKRLGIALTTWQERLLQAVLDADEAAARAPADLRPRKYRHDSLVPRFDSKEQHP
jgi:hypothetical protein